MDTLIVSQSIFYIVSSLAIIVLGVLLAMAVYQLFLILRNARQVSQDINQTYIQVKKSLKKAFVSFFSKKNSKN